MFFLISSNGIAMNGGLDIGNVTSSGNLSRMLNQTSENVESPIFTTAQYQIQAIILLLVIFFILTGNIITLFIIYRDRNMRTPQYLLITSLACSDLGVGLATAPLTLFTAFNRGNWALGDIACKYQAIANSTFYVVTMFTLMAMTMEKYFSVVRPLSRFVTAARTRKFIVAAWFATLAIAMLPLVGFGRYDFGATTLSCGIGFPEVTTERMYLILILSLGVFLPIAVMIVANSFIFAAVRRHSKRLQRHARGSVAKAGILASQKHFTITVIIIFTVFIGSWTPFLMLAVSAEIRDSSKDIPPLLGILAYWCGYAASAWNPVIYITRNRRFRQGAVRIKNSLFCRKADSPDNINGIINGISMMGLSDAEQKRISIVSTVQTKRSQVLNSGMKTL